MKSSRWTLFIVSDIAIAFDIDIDIAIALIN